MKLLIHIFLLTHGLLTWGQQPTNNTQKDSTKNIVKELQEVLVTAEKRELNPIDIPMTLSVVTPNRMVGENHLDLRSISSIVPNFYMQEGGLKLSTPLYVRGVGTVSGTPPVGLYIDGVPVFDKNAFVFELYDIRQIEVLKGPQTTLYGRNSINGVIHIHTNAPRPAFSLQAKAGYADDESQTYHLAVDFPINEVYNKLSFAYHKSEGYFRNRFDNNRKSNPSESYDMRYQGCIYPTSEWKIRFGANYNHAFDGGYAYHAVDSLLQDRYVVNYNTPSSYERDMFSAYANLKKDGQQTSFHSLTSYSRIEDEQMLDADFTHLDVFDNNKKSKQNLLTQEFNVQSIKGKKWDWTIGVFGFYKDLTNTYLATFGEDKSYLLPMLLDEAKYRNQTTTWGVAGFGQITVNELWKGMSFTAGLRYDYENCRLDYRDSLLFSTSSRFKEYHRSEDDRNFTAWLPKFSLLQKWNDNLSLYLTISKGYKAGGYNIIVNEMSSQMTKLGYEEEKLWNYEWGMKYFSANHRFHLNVSTFFIDWKDQQIFVMGMMGPSIKNAGDAHSFGGEMELRWELLPDLTYLFSAGYTNAEYYHNLEKSHEGNRIVMAPEFTGNTGFIYRKTIKKSWIQGFQASTTLNGFGKQYFDEANRLKQDPYFLWNMEVGITCKRFYLHFWGKNILDKAFFTYMLNNPVGEKLPHYNDMAQSGAPARFGASLTITL